MEINNELINYVFFGILTTLLNIIVYYLFARVLGCNYIVSNIIAWIISVLFAYITNRIWVFESNNDNIIKEIMFYFGGRLFSGIIDTILMFLFIDLLLLPDFYSKIFIQVVVVIFNYLFSKLVVFK